MPTAEPDDLFPERNNAEVTVITTVPFELRPSYVGREELQKQISVVFEGARKGNLLSSVLLLGDSGMGKSRTAKEFCRNAQQSDSTLRVFRGYGDGNGVAYGAFSHLLVSCFGITPGDTAEDSREKIIADLVEIMPASQVTEVAHLLAHMMRVSFPDSPVITPLLATPKQLQARLFLAIRKFFGAEAKKAPFILCLENLDLCDSETVAILQYLLVGLASLPVMVLITARQIFLDRYPDFGRGDTVIQIFELERLSDEESVDLLKELCRPLDETPPRLIEHVKSMEGSPRAILELMRLLLETEVIVRIGSISWQIDQERLDKLTLPSNFDDIARQRLEFSSEEERSLIFRATVFW